MISNPAEQSEESLSGKPVWLWAIVGIHFFGALVLLVVGYNGVDDFVDTFAVAALLAGWGWLLWRRVAWVRTATIGLHTVALVVLVLGSLIAVPYLFYARLGVAAAYVLVLIAWIWASVAPISGFLVWALRRRRVRAQFTEPTPPLRLSLSALFVLVAIFAVLSLGLFRQVQRDGVICVSNILGWRFRVYSTADMSERSIGRFIDAARRDDVRARSEAWHHIEYSPKRDHWIGELLTHDDSTARLATLTQMSHLSSKPADVRLRGQLLGRMQDSDPRVRSAALEKMRQLLSPRVRDAAVLQATRDSTSDPAPEVRLTALVNLVNAELPGPFLAPALAELVNDEHLEIRLRAIDELAKLEFEAYRFLPNLMDAVGDANREVRLYAAVAAGHVGGRSQELVPLLTDALREPAIAEQAASALMNFGPRASAAVPALLAATESDKYHLRTNAFMALAAIGPDAEPAIPKLIQMVQDRDTDGHYLGVLAITVLGEIGPPAGAAAPHLIESLQPHGRLPAVTSVPLALAKIAPESPETLAVLVESLNYHPAKKVDKVHGANMRLSAAKGLMLLGPQAAAAQSELRVALSDEDLHVRCHAAHALLQIDPNDPEHVRAWNAALDELQSLISQGRYDAIWCAGALGPDAASLVPTLAAQLSHPQPLPRYSSIGALAKLGAIDEAMKSTLEGLLNDPDKTVRRSAAEALFESELESQGP